jgi:hypothetical protein
MPTLPDNEPPVSVLLAEAAAVIFLFVLVLKLFGAS